MLCSPRRAFRQLFRVINSDFLYRTIGSFKSHSSLFAINTLSSNLCHTLYRFVTIINKVILGMLRFYRSSQFCTRPIHQPHRALSPDDQPQGRRYRWRIR